MNEITGDKKRKLKELIKQLHAGADPQQVKENFKQILGTVSSLDIAKIEQELIQEGMPREEIHRLCDVHMLVFQEQLGKQKPEAPTGSPVDILVEEHKIMLQLADLAITIVAKIDKAKDARNLPDEMAHLKHIAEDFVDSEKHYLREENVLFPILEKHGVTEPPAIMWTEHNRIRPEKKRFSSLLESRNSMSFQDFKKQLAETVESLRDLLSSHFFKENNILFPAALKVCTPNEWKQVRTEFDAIGYCRFTPQHLIAKLAPRIEELKPEALIAVEGLLQFDTGALTKDEIDALLITVPFDITFVDRDDKVKYFNKSEIFMRTKAVLGRKVQQCHPQKSVHIVNKILESFKNGEKDVAEFWIPMKGRMIHIRYFALRDKAGTYLGTMEVTQDVTDIRKLEGEQRLLDWK
jgi:DUF438 domain-containing protein